MDFLSLIRNKSKLGFAIEYPFWGWQERGSEVKEPPKDQHPSSRYALPSRIYTEIGSYYGQLP